MNPTSPKPDSGPASPAHGVLHAPWRDAYMQSLSSAAQQIRHDAEKPACFLTDYWNNPEHDERNLVICRVGEGPTGGMILLNRYPYANGHLLVALGDPRPRLLDYEPAQRIALWELVSLGADLAERTLSPQGLNIGVNQGVAAGAGAPSHLHAHIVPRWHGDVNFMAVVGNVRVIPSALQEMAGRYRKVWEQIARDNDRPA